MLALQCHVVQFKQLRNIGAVWEAGMKFLRDWNANDEQKGR